jgi:4'-phosphopantetheinyl transferase EntD
MAKAARISSAGVDLFPLAFRFDDARFGTCVAVRLPAASSTDPGSLLASLHTEEQEFGRSLRGPRLIEFVAGRHASRLARAGMPGSGSPTRPGLNGAPEVGGGVTVSISHTQTLAVALASTEQAYAIGVDIETIPTDTRGEELLAERILSPAERNGATIDTVRRLSIKEAAYKAIVALTDNHMPLRNISVERDADGGFRIHVLVAEMQVEVTSSRIEGHYLSLARARRAL